MCSSDLIAQQVTLLLVLLSTSKGAAGVTGNVFIVLAATLSAVGHVPVAGLVDALEVETAEHTALVAVPDRPLR